MLSVWRSMPIGPAILLLVLLVACGPATPLPAAADDAQGPVRLPAATWTALPTATIDTLFAPPTPRLPRPRATPTSGALDATSPRPSSTATTPSEKLGPQPATLALSTTPEANADAEATSTLPP